MGDKEKTLAGALFLITGLLLPILFQSQAGDLDTPEASQFYVHNALLELRMDASMRWLAPEFAEGAEEQPEGDESSAPDQTENSDPAKADEQEAVQTPFFQTGNWVVGTSELPDDRRAQLIRQIAVAAAAFGRRAEARDLLHEAKVELRPEDPFSYVVAGEPAPSPERLERDMGSTYLPPWMLDFIRDGLSLDEPFASVIKRHMEPFVARVGALAFFVMLIFAGGMLLLLFRRRLAHRFAMEDDTIGRNRFDAAPLQTYMAFLLWFVVSLAVGSLLSGVFSDGASKAQAMLVTYLTVAAAGVYIVKTQGRPRGASLLRTVDGDRHCLNKRAVLFGVGGYLISVPVVLLLSVVSASLLGGGDSSGINPAIPILVGSDTAIDRILIIVNVVLFAPLFEEFFFRGFLFRQFMRDLGRGHAVVLSGLVFASVHLSIDSFIPLLGLGIILALVYHTSQSLWASVITHALWNLATVVSVLTLFG